MRNLANATLSQAQKSPYARILCTCAAPDSTSPMGWLFTRRHDFVKRCSLCFNDRLETLQSKLDKENIFLVQIANRRAQQSKKLKHYSLYKQKTECRQQKPLRRFTVNWDEMNEVLALLLNESRGNSNNGNSGSHKDHLVFTNKKLSAGNKNCSSSLLSTRMKWMKSQPYT